MTPWTSPRSDLVAVLILLFPLVAPGQWVAFDDHAPGSGTHTNATHYHTFG